MSEDYSGLTHIRSHADLALYELIPTVVWIFDLDKHGWWWGNDAAIKFWGLDCLDDLVNKDLSGDTQGARDRTKQTFDLAVKNGLTVDPWTTYPNGKPKHLHMMHRAVLLGPEKHRGIIAYINEEVNMGETPENLLLMEAMRYTTVLVTSFTLEGEPVIENPAATEAYKSVKKETLREGMTTFAARFKDPEEGRLCLQRALDEEGGRWTHMMKTDNGVRRHTLDIRMSRHALSGEFMLMVTEYDITDLFNALTRANDAQEKLRKLAHYDALTGLPSLHLFQESAQNYMAQAKRHNHKIAVMFIDLDGFKGVNDTWGHAIGDAVLKAVGERLSHSVRSCDLVARIGGDEFVVLVTELVDPCDAELVAQKILDSLSQPISVRVNDREARAQVGASIGISIFPDEGENIELLTKNADDCMYDVKRKGKNNYIFPFLEQA